MQTANATTDLGPTSTLPTILIVGPSPRSVGGMATAVSQHRSLSLAGRYHSSFFPTTVSSSAEESWFSRLVRHVGHLSKLSRMIRRLRPAIVHIHTCSGFSFYRSLADLLVAKANHCSVVVHIHGAAFDEFFESRSLLGKQLIRWSLAQVDRVIALSETWRTTLQAMSPKASIVVIENAVSLPQESKDTRPGAKVAATQTWPNEAGSKASQSPSVPHFLGHSTGSTAVDTPHIRPCRFLMLARMDTWKGVDDLLDALQQLRVGRFSEPLSLRHTATSTIPPRPSVSLSESTQTSPIEFQCALAGPTGSAGNDTELNRKIAERSLTAHVRYVGTVRGEQKKNWLSWADVFVQPSHHEGMPIAMLEAMAVGLPVVATRVGAVAEVITDKHEGLLVPAKMPDELARVLRTLTTDSALRTKLGHAAAQLAKKRFGLPRLDMDLVRLYNELVHNIKQTTRQPTDTLPHSIAATSA